MRLLAIAILGAALVACFPPSEDKWLCTAFCAERGLAMAGVSPTWCYCELDIPMNDLRNSENK